MKKKMNIQNNNVMRHCEGDSPKQSRISNNGVLNSVTIKIYTVFIKIYTFCNHLKNSQKFFNAVYQSNTEFFKLDFRFIVRLARDLYIAKNCYKNWPKSEMKKWFAENKVLNHYNFLESFCVYNNINVYLTK